MTIKELLPREQESRLIESTISHEVKEIVKDLVNDFSKGEIKEMIEDFIKMRNRKPSKFTSVLYRELESNTIQ